MLKASAPCIGCKGALHNWKSSASGKLNYTMFNPHGKVGKHQIAAAQHGMESW